MAPPPPASSASVDVLPEDGKGGIRMTEIKPSIAGEATADNGTPAASTDFQGIDDSTVEKLLFGDIESEKSMAVTSSIRR